MQVETKKLKAVEAPTALKDIGIVAFQIVEFKTNFFGIEVISRHDTKIMKDGSQFVIEGDGFIPSGYQVF